MAKSFTGAAFITGASSGLGRALAPRLAADGQPVAIAARRLSALEDLAAEITAAGGTAQPIALDVSDPDAVQRAVAQAEAELGSIGLMIANAGIDGLTPAENFKASDVSRVLQVNLVGAAACYEAVLPGMLERGDGQLVGVASLAGFRGLPGAGAYCASKSGLIALLESLRIELAPRGISVTTLNPGFVKTPMTAPNQHPMPFLMELDAAAKVMHRAIRRRASECSFPKSLASITRTGKLLPNGLYDRILKNKKADKGGEQTDWS
ncbi:MAG: SDR family NAD(P)-dependent oxidoreductase [Bradymonadia bacterium]